MGKEDAENLRRQILIEIGKKEAIKGRLDEYGQRHTVIIKIRNLDNEADVVTGWILKTDEDSPRLTTCYVN